MESRQFDSFTRLLARGGTRRQALSMALAGGLARFTHRRQVDDVPHWDITIEDVTAGRILGQVATGDTGLRFKGWLDQMPCVMVQALDGSEVFAIKRDGDDLVTALGGGALTARLPLAEAKAARRLGDPHAQIERAHAITTVDGDASIVRDIAARPEYALLPGLSFALGEAGATGLNYPPVLPIHAMGLAAAINLNIDPDVVAAIYTLRMKGSATDPLTPVESIDPNQDPQVAERKPTVLKDPILALKVNQNLQVDPCYDPDRQHDCRNCKTKPNQDDCCYGMCGPCCTCWTRVCGDCCYHQFCADHDSVLGQCEGVDDPLDCIAGYFPVNFAVEGCDGELF